jgi:hypothetical protein
MEKHYVYSARTTEAGLKALNAKKDELKMSWDQFIAKAVSETYKMKLETIALPASTHQTELEAKRAVRKAEKEAKDKAKETAKTAIAKAKADAEKAIKDAQDKAKATIEKAKAGTSTPATNQAPAKPQAKGK